MDEKDQRALAERGSSLPPQPTGAADSPGAGTGAAAEEATTTEQTVPATPAQPGNELRSVPAAEVLPPERDSVTPAPLAPDAPYAYANLDDQTFHKTLSDFVQQAQGQYAEFGLTLYYRVLPGLRDAQRRFKEHEKDSSYRLDGCAGIEEYIKKLGLTPARVRKWRQRDKERQFASEVKLLIGGSATCPECGGEKGHAPSCSHYERHLSETQREVAQALLTQGYRKKDAARMVKAAEGQDLESLFRSVMAAHPSNGGGTTATESTAPGTIQPGSRDDKTRPIWMDQEITVSYNAKYRRMEAEAEYVERVKQVGKAGDHTKDRILGRITVWQAVYVKPMGKVDKAALTKAVLAKVIAVAQDTDYFDNSALKKAADELLNKQVKP